MTHADAASSSAEDGRAPVDAMLGCIGDLLRYTAKQSAQSWAADGMRVDATLRQLTLLGLGAAEVPPAVRTLAPEVPWSMLAGLPDRYLRDYVFVELSAAWDVVVNDVLPLQAVLRALQSRWSPASG